MSRPSVSDLRNRFNMNRMLCDISNRNLNDMSSSSDNKSSNVEIIKSSNCVINIDYVVQEEKISFEVFRSSIDSCVFHKKFSLQQSKSCTHLTSVEKFNVTNKMVQTEEQFGTSAILPPDNIGPAPFCRNFEYPVKDIPNSNEILYKENYDVSNFKFPENTNIVKLQNSNFCCLDFDGTRSSKRNYSLHRTKNKQTIHVKRVRSDINIKKCRMYSPSPFRGLSPSPFREVSPSPFTARQNIVAHSVYEVNKIPNSKTELNKEALDTMKYKKKKHRVVENESNTNTIQLKKQERAAFEFVLALKDDETNKQNKNEKEKNDHHHKKHRKIIVTSNTLEPTLIKPNTKDVEQQTNFNDIINLERSSVNELYMKSNFSSRSVANSMVSGDQNISNKKKKREKKKRMGVSIFECVNIKGSHHHLEMPVNQKRPTIPRRRIDDPRESRILESNRTNVQSTPSTIQNVEDDTISIASKRKGIPRKPLKTEEKLRDTSPRKLPKDENAILREKISNLFKEEHPTSNSDYNNKIEELCSLINNLVQERDRSRSRTPPKLRRETNSPKKTEPPSRQNSFKKESLNPEKTISKTDRLKINHNKNDSVTIMDTKQNTVPRNVLQVSPRANEILNSTDFKRKNTMATYPVSIMPDPVILEQNKINNAVVDAPLVPVTKLASPVKKPISKKSTETKRNCSSVTFSSQVAIIGDDSHLKNTLFSINDNFKRSKTLPSKQEFCKSTSSRNSTVASSVVCEMPSSVSNFDLNSLPEEKRNGKEKSKKAEKSKIPQPGAIENCSFLSARTNQLTKNINSSFQKRKDYYLTLKMKLKNKPEPPEIEKKSEESPSETKPLEDKIALNPTLTLCLDPPKSNQKSKSRIPLYKQSSKREISPKDFILKNKKEHSLFPYEFSGQDDTLNRTPINAYPLEVDSNFPRSTEKDASPYKVGEVKQQISSFLQSYPLKMDSPPGTKTGARPKNPSLSLKNNVSSTFIGNLSSIFESKSSEENIKNIKKDKHIFKHKPKQQLKEHNVKLVLSPNKLSKFKGHSTKNNAGKKNHSSKLSSKTITMYRSPRIFKYNEGDLRYLSVNKQNSPQQKRKKSKLSIRTKQINETTGSKFVYYSTKPTVHRHHHHRHHHDEDSDLCELAKVCTQFCCFDSNLSKNSSLFTQPNSTETIEKPKSENKSKTRKKNTSKQINEDNTQLVYQYYNHYVDDRYIHGQQVPTFCDLPKVCKYFCCPDNRPTREESDFELPKDITVVKHPPIEPTIIRPTPTGTTGPTIIRPQPTRTKKKVPSKQINEDNTQMAYEYYNHYVDDRYIHGQQVPTFCDLPKACKYLCCPDNRPTREESDFKLPKDITVVKHPPIEPTIIRPTPTGTTGPTIIRPKPAETVGLTIIRPTPTETSRPTLIRPKSSGHAGPTIIRPAPLKKSVTAFPILIDSSRQIGEDNSQLLFHSKLQTEHRYVHEPLLSDLGKVCRHFCCVEQPSAEVSEFKLPRKVEPIRTSVNKVEVRSVLHKHPLWNLLPRKALVTSISEEIKVDNFPSSNYKLPLEIQPEIPLKTRSDFVKGSNEEIIIEKPAKSRNQILIVRNSQIQTDNSTRRRNEFVIQSSQISELASNISGLSNSNESNYKIALDSLLLLPNESNNESKRKYSSSDSSVKKKSKTEEIPIDVILKKKNFLSKSDFESKYSEFDLVSKTSNSTVENVSQNSSDLSVKKSLSRKYLRLLKIDSFTNFIRKKTTAFKKIVSSKKYEKKDK